MPLYFDFFFSSLPSLFTLLVVMVLFLLGMVVFLVHKKRKRGALFGGFFVIMVIAVVFVLPAIIPFRSVNFFSPSLPITVQFIGLRTWYDRWTFSYASALEFGGDAVQPAIWSLDGLYLVYSLSDNNCKIDDAVRREAACHEKWFLYNVNDRRSRAMNISQDFHDTIIGLANDKIVFSDMQTYTIPTGEWGVASEDDAAHILANPDVSGNLKDFCSTVEAGADCVTYRDPQVFYGIKNVVVAPGNNRVAFTYQHDPFGPQVIVVGFLDV